MKPQTPMKPRLRSRMVAYIVMLLTVLMVLTTLMGIRRESQGILDQMQKDGIALAKSYALSAENSLLLKAGLGRLTGEASRTRAIDYLKIIDRNGRVIGHTDVNRIGEVTHDPLYSRALRTPITALEQGKRPITVADQNENGRNVYRVIVPLVILDSVVGVLEVGLDMAGIAHAVQRTNIQSLIIAVGALTFGGLLTWFLSLSLTRPISDLVNAAERIAAGDLDHQIAAQSQDEVGHLAASFNYMTQRLREYTGNLIRINDQLKAHAATIEELRIHNENILASIRAGVLTVDLGGRVTTLNRAGADILALETDAIGRRIADVPGAGHGLLSVVDNGLNDHQLLHGYEIEVPLPSGRTVLSVDSTFLCDQESRTCGLVVTFDDVTEVRELQRRILESEKLAAMGELAAGVAHEVRNPLGAVKTCAQFLRGSFTADHPNMRFIQLIIRETDRLDQLVERLLNFTRSSSGDFQYENVNELLENAAALAELKVAGQKLAINKDYDTSLPCSFVDARRLQLGFLNIMLNAIDAMPDGGHISVGTSYDPVARLIRVSISDTGEGIPEDRIGKVFSPFFTTRPSGTGLGLAIVKRVVTEHGGTIGVESQVGAGTKFTITLPLQVEAGLLDGASVPEAISQPLDGPEEE